MEQFSRTSRAVMFTDVVGFTSIMERCEQKAMDILLTIRSCILPLLSKHKGDLLKEMGDSTLNLFDSPGDAVRCARSLQSELSDNDFDIRIGIHWGDVLLEKNDVFGDTVNIASRLESISAPGGVCLSGEVLRNYGSGRRPSVNPLGLRRLKGLGRLVDVFALKHDTQDRPSDTSKESGNLDEGFDGNGEAVPSLGVLLFENRGSEDEDFYAWSITSDLISDLARAGEVSITPLSRMIQLQEDGIESEMLARELNVRFLAKGTLWRKDNSFHLSIELLDTVNGRLVWTDSWQDDWRELPAIKGKLADGLLKAIGIEPYSYPWIIGQETGGTEAYELYLRGRHLYEKRHSHDDALSARSLFERALSIDPEHIPAMIMLAASFRDEGDSGMSRQILDKAFRTTLESGDRSYRLQVLNGIGILQLQTSEPREARATFRKVLRLSRSLGDRLTEARALNNTGLVHWGSGAYAEALEVFTMALGCATELQAHSLEARVLFNIGLVSWSTGDDEKALEYYARAMKHFEESEDLSAKASVLRNMGSIYSRRSDLDRALEMTGRSLDIYRKLGDRPGECRSLINQGNIYLKCGLYEHAEELYSEALVICTETRDEFTESIALLNIGLLLMDSGRTDEGEEILLRTLEVSRRLEDPEGESISLCYLGRLHLGSGRTDSAVTLLREGIEIMEDIGLKEDRTLAYVCLAHAELDGSDPCGELTISEILQLLESAEASLGSVSSQNRTAVLWLLSEAYRRLSELPLSGRSKTHGWTHRRIEILELAMQDIRRISALITDPDLRDSFMNRIHEHRCIIAAMEPGGTEPVG